MENVNGTWPFLVKNVKCYSYALYVIPFVLGMIALNLYMLMSKTVSRTKGFVGYFMVLGVVVYSSVSLYAKSLANKC